MGDLGGLAGLAGMGGGGGLGGLGGFGGRGGGGVRVREGGAWGGTGTGHKSKFQKAVGHIRSKHPRTLSWGEAKMRIEEVYQKRLKLHSEVCSERLKNGSRPDVTGELPLVYVPRHNFSYCLISKTGTTSMLSALDYYILSKDRDERVAGKGGIQCAAKSG